MDSQAHHLIFTLSFTCKPAIRIAVHGHTISSLPPTGVRLPTWRVLSESLHECHYTTLEALPAYLYIVRLATIAITMGVLRLCQVSELDLQRLFLAWPVVA